MVKIRLARFGKKGQPYYRIVVSDEKKAISGKYVEQIGYYHPLHNPPKIKVDFDRYEFWLKNGAKPSDTVKSLIKNAKKIEEVDK